jgi:ADP-ribose diphosphatase
MIEKWKLLENNEILKTRPFNVLEKIYDKPSSTEKFTASVLKCPNWANVIATKPNGDILLIRQFRFGNDQVTLEIPGGVIEEGELPLVGIKRELEEETGYISDRWTQIGVVDANPAIQTNKCYSFLAENIQDTGKLHLDPDEIIDQEFATPAQVEKYILEGKITNTYIIAAFYWLNAHQKKRKNFSQRT